MRNKISILLLSLITALMFTGCVDEPEPYGGPYNLTIVGLDTVIPETTHDYTLGNITNPESYTWKVDGPAEIVGETNGATVTIKFNSVGDVTISVSNGVDSGSRIIEVAKTEAAVTATLNGTGILKNGASDTVFFEFAASVEGLPTLAINTEDSTAFNRGETPFVSGTLSDLVKVDDRNYYAIYTAGEGNGTPEAAFGDITSTAAYGSVILDSVYAPLYSVDNIAPVASLSYAKERVNNGSTVTITATFSEPVMSADPSDSTLFITFKGATVPTERDSLMATDNPLVYTYEYKVKGGEGNGAVEVGLENIADFAGNSLIGVSNNSVLVVDNTNPVVTGTATDGGNYASIKIASNNTGIGMYLITKAGVAAPTTAEAFMAANGVVSGSVDLIAGNTKTVAEALAKGSYDVYFLAMDEAGNYSAIKKSNLAMN